MIKGKKNKSLFSRFSAVVLSGALICSCAVPAFAMEQPLIDQSLFKERGLPEVMDAIAMYTGDELPADGQAPEQANAQTKLIFTKLISKILKNSTLSAASALTIIHLFFPGKEVWGAGIGLGIAAFDAAADIAKSYFEIMRQKNAANATAA
jgi:hypothetical protein